MKFDEKEIFEFVRNASCLLDNVIYGAITNDVGYEIRVDNFDETKSLYLLINDMGGIYFYFMIRDEMIINGTLYNFDENVKSVLKDMIKKVT